MFVVERKFVICVRRSSALPQAYWLWAEKVKNKMASSVQIVWEDQLQAWPQKASVWVLGKNNIWIQQLQPTWQEYGIQLTEDRLQLPAKQLDLHKESAALVVRQVYNKNHYIGWLSAPDKKILLRMADKLPHYGKYGAVTFSGEQNNYKKQWPVVNSPMHRTLK